MKREFHTSQQNEPNAELLAEFERLKRKLHFLETIIDELPNPIFAKDSTAEFCLFNKAYEQFFQVQREKLKGLTVLDLDYLAPADRECYQREDLNAIANGVEVHYEASYATPTGRRHTLYWSKGICVPATGEKGLVGTIVDISTQKRLEQELLANSTELQQTLKELSRISQTDSMTGLPNRRFFEDRLREYISVSNRYDQPFSLLMADIDHFKHINDTFGHDAGDEILKAFADVLQCNCRNCDYCASFGGEEFMLFLPMTRAEDARMTAERIRLATRENCFLPDGHRLTVSIGVAEFQLGDTPDTLKKRVDQAMYQAKNNGRDQVAG